MNFLKSDLLLSLFGMSFAGAYSWVSADIPKSMLSDEVGPGGVPFAIGTSLFLVCALLFLKSTTGILRLKNKTEAGSSLKISEPSSPKDFIQLHKKAALLFGVLVAYVALLPYLGYLLAVTALFYVSTSFAGASSRVGVFMFSMAGALALFLIFEMVMGVKMPRGILGF